MATNDVYLRVDAGDGTNGVRLRRDSTATFKSGRLYWSRLRGAFSFTPTGPPKFIPERFYPCAMTGLGSGIGTA